MYRKSLNLRVLLGALLMCAWVPTAAAQPASFAAIRTIELEPALPGTEKVYRQLAEQLAYLNDHLEPARDVYVRLEPAAPLSPGRPVADRNQRARCTLRTDLSKPRSIALECRDLERRYIGTLRSRSYRELVDRLFDYHLLAGGPNARPLTYLLDTKSPTQAGTSRSPNLKRCSCATVQRQDSLRLRDRDPWLIVTAR